MEHSLVIQQTKQSKLRQCEDFRVPPSLSLSLSPFSLSQLRGAFVLAKLSSVYCIKLWHSLQTFTSQPSPSPFHKALYESPKASSSKTIIWRNHLYAPSPTCKHVAHMYIHVRYAHVANSTNYTFSSASSFYARSMCGRVSQCQFGVRFALK